MNKGNQQENKYSLCIPRLETNVTREYIFGIFSRLKIGHVENIIEIPLKNDNKHKRVIILIRWNYTNPKTEIIKKRLENNEAIKVVHDMPWYWKVITTLPQK
jgi:hypothetical protein